jgi:site-specific recombinase XerD
VKVFLSDIELNTLSDTILKNASEFGSFFYDVFSLYYKFGFRTNELLSRDRWNVYDNDNFILNTEKGSNPRIIKKSDLNSSFFRFYFNTANHFIFTSPSSINIYFNRFSNLPQLYVLDKKISVYLFRHNLIKQMFNQGSTVQDIANFMGEVENKNILGYINSAIYFNDNN